VRLQASCPCCGQTLRSGWRLEQRWGRFIQFAGPGKITPVGIAPLDAPPALVRQAAWLAKWATAPEAIAALVFTAADALVRAGWREVLQAPPATPAPSTPSTPWPPTWPK
jgi:hypothetical protein